MNPHPQFYHPAYVCISGQSYSGKTIFLLQVLSNVSSYFDTDSRPFKKIVYYYGSQWQAIFETFQALGVTFHAGLPESLDQLFDKTGKPSLLIIDGLMSEMQKNQFMEDVSTKRRLSARNYRRKSIFSGKKQCDHAKEHTALHSV